MKTLGGLDVSKSENYKRVLRTVLRKASLKDMLIYIDRKTSNACTYNA